MNWKVLAIAAAVAAAGFWQFPLADDRPFNAEDFVAKYYAEFQQPNYLVDDLMAFYRDDVVFSDPTFEILAQGKAEVRKLYAEIGTENTAYTDISWEIADIVSQDDTIVVRGKWSGRFFDCEFDVDFMTLWKLEEGKIAQQHDFFAAVTFDRQVGWNGTTATCDEVQP